MTEARKTPDEIVAIRAANPKMRERDLARIHGFSEAELVAAHCGRGSRRLRVDVAALLNGLPAAGEVMALTRNESAVHEKIGPYEGVSVGAGASMVLGKEIDLRIFPQRWASGFVVEKTGEDGAVRHSLQFFDAAGDAVHKVHVRPATDRAAWDALVHSLLHDDQSPGISVPALDPPLPAGPPADAAELRRRWKLLTDTHQFFGMLRDLNLERQQALGMAGDDNAWMLASDSVPQLFSAAAASGLPIMVFVGNRGCIQIHAGPIHEIKTMGPWLNVMDPTFHLHLRLDQIEAVWAVRKPTSAGHVSSVEAFDAAGELIIQFFGKRQEGTDERPEWRQLVETLPTADRSNAA
jgi:putative hemin transport protein